MRLLAIGYRIESDSATDTRTPCSPPHGQLVTLCDDTEGNCKHILTHEEFRG